MVEPDDSPSPLLVVSLAACLYPLQQVSIGLSSNRLHEHACDACFVYSSMTAIMLGAGPVSCPSDTSACAPAWAQV